MTSTKEEVLDQINKTKSAFLNADHKNLYDAYNGASTLLLGYRQYGGRQGWSKNIVEANTNKSIYSINEQAQVEEAFQGMAHIIDPIFLNTQDGGGTDYLKPGITESSFLTYESPFGPFNPDDISIDKTYKKVTEYIDELDEKNRILAKTLGPFRFFDEMKVDPFIPLPPPFAPARFQIPAKLIVPLMMTFLELIRLFVTFGPYESDFLRKISSLLLAGADLANGSWKNAILTGVGIFGSSPLLLGLVGKILNNTMELMSPEIRVAMRDSIYKGVKSSFIGFWLYMFSILAPDFARNMVNTSLASLQKPLEEFNKKIGDLEERTQAQLGRQGLQIRFQRLPLEMLPSLEDIQNIQVLAARPEIYCSQEFQEVISPLMKLVPIRLALEMLNIPTQADDMAVACKGIEEAGISNTVTKALEPEITPIPGGPLNKLSEKISVGGAKSSSSTRRRRRRRIL